MSAIWAVKVDIQCFYPLAKPGDHDWHMSKRMVLIAELTSHE
jgi:hypothetical protein